MAVCILKVRVDFTESESEDSSNEENVEPAENSHASSGLEGTFQVIARRSENEQAEHAPSLISIQNFVKRERRNKIVAQPMGTNRDFENYAVSHSGMPLDENDTFVIGHRITANGNSLKLSDIQLLQVATAPLVFTKAAELLLESWIERWPIDNEIGEKVSSFATYFLNTWVDSPLKYWFEGASPVISNNSGLESANKNFKDRHVFRRQTPFTQFVEAAEKIPAEWSSQPELQTPAVDYKIDRDVLFKAFTQSKERRIMAHQGTRYILPATGTLYSAPECQSWIAAYVAGTNLDAYLTNWNDYKDTRFKYHAVKAREREAFLCTCQIGIKKELCKHILLVKYEKQEFRWPEEFAALPLNTKFTGRPRKRQLVTRYQGN
ncbi:hypothetical protein DdX_01117 [Ditylenchus destructor]|uniref:SWIM-type domain-containing protein n=1 Tax=Ditylenchus destructor TaxID=166010 RepID=A0AAD4NL25_9BILA|nr:hypothetical protein DdX_01117 [Ditylenchus destructor]